jgi:hypothetical protein
VLPAAAFAGEQSADYRYMLALTSWHAGAYLISIEATAGKHSDKRELRIDVK